ncbi:MAG TPA: hypothetical protein VGK81_04205 [Anaerolineae bacterium]
MATPESDREEFLHAVRQPHRKMARCFMTGKACVYEQVIENHLKEVRDGKSSIDGFMIMSFRPNLSTFYDWSLTRCFKAQYGAETDVLKRADQVRRTGYIICEKVCKRIQESSFVVSDISVNRGNVFYELGIAYGLRQKLIVIHDANSPSAPDLINDYFPPTLSHKIWPYQSLQPLTAERFSAHIFHDKESGPTPRENNDRPAILILDLSTPGQNKPAADDDIALTFMDLAKSAVGVSVANIVKELRDPQTPSLLPLPYVDLIDDMKTAVTVEQPHGKNFDAVRSAIDNAFCVLIRTSNAHPFCYFWLGYCHAIGKNVIPIYEVNEPGDQINDIAFDIRSLWHLALVKSEPTKILAELQEILKQMILTDFMEWSRKAFWSRIFGRSGRISIFTGAMHIDAFHREMIGDWDLRTASELMSYFSTHQMVATIESPIYQPKPSYPGGITEYMNQISRLLLDRNAVVIASADVNPLTELLLGKIYEVGENHLFKATFDPAQYPQAVAAIKYRHKEVAAEGCTPGPSSTSRFFYQEREIQACASDADRRGFIGHWLPGLELLETYYGQTDEGKSFTLYAHLAIAMNPFTSPEARAAGREYFVIVLNGISGPSTFALTQLLTGGMGGEFVDYPGGFKPNFKAEEILKAVQEELNRNVSVSSHFCGLQVVAKVTIGAPEGQGQLVTFDNRRIKSWELVPGTLTLIPRRNPPGRNGFGQ